MAATSTSSGLVSRLSLVASARLALRLLWREARSGELTLILLALLIAVTSTTAIALFSARLELALNDKGGTWLGGDLRVRSTQPFAPDNLQKVSAVGLKHAETLSFPSVVMAGDNMTLASIKGVDAGYPLKARLLLLTPGATEPVLQSSGPGSGEAWVEPRLLALLNAKVGDALELGDRQFQVTGEILEESDRGGGFTALSPRMMVHLDDLAGSPLLGPGSRLRYQLLLAGDSAALKSLQADWQLSANEKFEDVENGNERMAASLQRARQYLSLASLLAVVLASVAVAVSARRYASRNFDVSALMRTFGLLRRDVLRVYVWQLVALGVAAALVGALLALVLQEAILALLTDVLPEQLPSAPLTAWMLGLSSGLVTLLGFGLPQILPLAAVPPLRVLRRDLAPVPLAGWLLTALALLALSLLLWVFTGNALLTLLVMGGGALLVLLLLLLLQFGIGRLHRLLQQRDLPLHWRFAWQHLSRNRQQTAGQVLAFGLTLQVMVVIALLRNDLLADWQASLPAQAPNVFALNIQSFEREAFAAALEQRGFVSARMYPMVPGRLLTINGKTIQELGLQDIGAIDRDLALTHDDQLPDSNRIVAGDWAVMAGSGQLSLEAGLAQRLGVKLGDQLQFRAGGVDFEATVSSLREVDWTSLSPNFFMMFSADLMASLPASYITSFYVPADQQAALTSLIREFPAVNVLDMQALLTQLHSLLAQVGLAIELILAVVLLAAVLVMVSALLASLRERLQEGALLRTLGASSRMIRRAQLSEFSLLGAMAAVLALLAAEALCWALYRQVLDIPWNGLGWIWLWLPLVASIGLAMVGTLMLRRTVTVAPVIVLRELA